MGRSMTLPLILLGAGAIGCVVAGISLWRQAHRSAGKPLPIAIVEGSSLAETLHGETVVGTCPACGAPLRFAVESLPRVGDVLCPNCGEPVDPEGLERRLADRVAVVAVADVEQPSAGLLYIFAAPEGEGATPIIKRVVAPPSWGVRIEGGDLYIDSGSPGPVRKNPDDERFPRVIVHEQGALRNQPASPSFWEIEPRGNRVAHEFRPRTVWAREALPTPVVDAYPSQAVERRRSNPVPDIWAVGEALSDEPFDAKFVYRTVDRTFSLEVGAGGAWMLSLDDRTLAAGALPDWSEKSGFRFGLLDRQIFLVRPGRESIILPLGDLPLEESPLVPSPSPLAIVVPSNVTLTIVRVERDVYYLPPGGMAEPWIEPRDAAGKGWFVLGDYPSYSIDSRQFGRLPRETILGKPLLPPLGAPATE